MMLLNILKRGMASLVGRPPAGTAASAPRPLSPSAFEQVHGDAPVDAHLDALLGGLYFGDRSYREMFVRCMRETGTGFSRVNVFHRTLAGINLANYFLYSLGIEGARVECGAYRGASALLMCRIARALKPEFDGAGYHLIDSFEGFSRDVEQDHVLLSDSNDGAQFGPAFPPGGIGNNTSAEHVQRALHEFPRVAIHKGWIPAVFSVLPDTRWSFVYLDVDIYEPTLAGLENFYPRLSAGGVIITDDFDAPMCPGVRRAWEAYCAPRGISYITLDTHQAVIIGQ